MIRMTILWVPIHVLAVTTLSGQSLEVEQEEKMPQITGIIRPLQSQESRN